MKLSAGRPARLFSLQLSRGLARRRDIVNPWRRRNQLTNRAVEAASRGKKSRPETRRTRADAAGASMSAATSINLPGQSRRPAS
jgi:hypothetical protein